MKKNKMIQEIFEKARRNIKPTIIPIMPYLRMDLTPVIKRIILIIKMQIKKGIIKATITNKNISNIPKSKCSPKRITA